ncbi:MAG: diguanylate cyclase [Bacteroidetes bacterium]|nr:MAG: diguanylate cyclase [Bacteroidota bacterium]
MQEQTHQVWNLRIANQIFESMADGVFTMDTYGRISFWNKSMERISGYTAKEALGQSCQLLQCSRCFGQMCPSDINKCKIVEHGDAEAKECFLRHKDGHDVATIKNASVVRDENNSVIGVVETITDLSELNKARQKAMEAELRLKEIHRLDNIIGKSRAMRQVFDSIRAAAASEATILVKGDSGTGKELVASAIHYNSARSKGPFITVNCSALSESLLESELFGHIKGAYTGAVRDRIGRFEEADGGSIFIDEIGELSPLIQVKLLRVLQEREIERVGESKERKVNIRVITATHQDLLDLVRKGHFREDLYYRLKVFPVFLPGLRERKDDIPLLTSHFISAMNTITDKAIKGLTIEAMRLFMDYPWPGNVRELENAIEHAFVLCNRDQISPTDLPVEIRQPDYFEDCSQPLDIPASSQAKRKKLSKNVLLELLDQCEWNKAEVARRVGLSRTSIWQYMKKWDIPLRKER